MYSSTQSKACEKALSEFESYSPSDSEQSIYTFYRRIFDRYFQATVNRHAMTHTTTPKILEIDFETFCSMYSSLLASAGLMQAVELADIDRQLPGYEGAKISIVHSVAMADKYWTIDCIGFSAKSNQETTKLK